LAAGGDGSRSGDGIRKVSETIGYFIFVEPVEVMLMLRYLVQEGILVNCS
jgi:hypothetical protein